MGSEIFLIRADNALIYGRNSFSSCCKEILFFPPNTKGTTKVEIFTFAKKIC